MAGVTTQRKPTQEKLIADFSGGERDASVVYPADNEAIEIINGDIRGPGLAPMAGALSLTQVDDAPSYDITENFVDTSEYVSANGESMWVSKRGRCIWVGPTRTAWSRLLLDAIDFEFNMLDHNDTLFNRCPTGGNATNHGTAPCKIATGHVRFFDGLSYIDTETPMPKPFGISVWVKDAGTLTDYQSLVDCLGATPGFRGASLYINAGTLGCLVSDNYATGAYVRSVSGLVDDLSGWHLFSVTYKDNEYPVLYVDGQELTGAAVTHFGAPGILNIGTADVCLGARVSSSDRYFHGYMGDVSCYDQTGASPPLISSSIAAQYLREADRYAEYATGEGDVKWLPLYGTSIRSGAVHQRARSVVDGRETFRQIGAYLYHAPHYPSPADYTYRWDGFYVAEGTATVDDTTRLTLDHIGLPSTWGIHAGDTVYFRVWDATRVEHVWDVLNGRVIKSIDPGTGEMRLYDGYVTTAKGESGSSDWVEYVIVRTHRMGVMAGTTTAAALGTSASGLSAGTYRYTWRYTSVSGYSGTHASYSTPYSHAGPLANGIAVSGWLATPGDMDINGVEIYCSIDDAPAILITTLTRATYAEQNFATSWEHTAASATSGAQLETDAHLHTRPGALRRLHPHSSRLYAVDITLPHYVYLSTLNKYEYFPVIESAADSETSVQATIGFRKRIGNSPAEEIIGFESEGGAYSTVGLPGGNLLIYLPTRAVRWMGTDFYDFQAETAFAHGAAGPDTIMNAGGYIVWLTPTGNLMRLTPGGNVPERIEVRRFPRGIPLSAALLSEWQLGYWNGYYMLRGPNNGYWNATVFLVDAQQLAWVSYAPAGVTSVADLYVSQRAATHAVVLTTATGLYAAFESTAVVAITYTSVLSPDSVGDITKRKKIKTVTMSFKPGLISAVSQVSLYVYDSHSWTYEQADENVAITAAHNPERVRVKLRAQCNVIEPKFQLYLSSVLPAAHLDWIRIEYEVTMVNE